MSRSEDFDTGFWTGDFLELGRDAKYLYIWSFTNEHNNWAGLYEVARPVILFETGLTARQFDAALAELQGGDKLFYEQGALWVKARVKRIRSKSPTMAESIAKSVGKIGERHPLRVAFLRAYHDFDWTPLDALRKALSVFPLYGCDPDTPSIPPREVRENLHQQGLGLSSFTSQGSEKNTREDIESLCSTLAARIIENGTPAARIDWPSTGWRSAARLLLDKDSRPHEEALRLVEWSQSDDFWRTNVLSMPTFRKQYDRLRLKAGARAPEPGKHWLEMAERMEAEDAA